MYAIFASVSARLRLSPCDGRRAALAEAVDAAATGVDRVFRSGMTVAAGEVTGGCVLALACTGCACGCAS